MALAETTLASAFASSGKSLTVASATSIAPGRMLQIDGEVMEVDKSYSTGTSIPVLRGRQGTLQVAHESSARVVHGDPSDFTVGGGVAIAYPLAGRARQVTSITTDASTVTLPPSGSDLLVVLNGTSVINLTVPVPTKDLDGCELTLASNGAAAHVITFTGGLSGGGSGYDVLTVNAGAPVAFRFIAINELWLGLGGVPMAGTVTNLTATIT